MLEAIVTLIVATTALLGSPGPATIALAATGASFGIRQGARFLAGILTGLALVVVLTAAGVSAILLSSDFLAGALLAVSTLYIVYVAFKIASAPIIDAEASANKAPNFRDGFILNLTNPKAYAAFAALFSAFSLPMEPVVARLIFTGGVSFLAAVIIDILWLVLGTALAGAFANPKLARPLRLLFALMMLAAVFWSLAQVIG